MIRTTSRIWTATLLCLAALAAFQSCKKYDDTEIRSDIESLEGRVSALEAWQASVNSDITTLQNLISALQNRDYITGVTPLTEDGEQVGYTISFGTADPITVRNGKDGADGQDGANGKDGADGKNGADGQDGTTPVISVKMDSDSLYYWTVDGEFLTNADGEKMPVSGSAGKDGEDGEDAVAPQVRISDDGYWQLSTDEGTTWEDMTDSEGDKIKASGEDGDSFFKDVDATTDPTCVTFTLADGTSFSVPVVSEEEEITLAFTEACSVLDIVSGEDVNVTISGAGEDDIDALVAELKATDGSNSTDIYTKADEISGVTVTLNDTTSATVTVNKAGTAEGLKAVLKVTLIDSAGQETSVSQVVRIFSNQLQKAAQSGETVTYTLNEDEDLTTDGNEPITVSEGTSLTIDLANCTLSAHALAMVGTGTSLTVKNGTLKLTNEDCDGIQVLAKSSTLTLSNVTVDATGISGNLAIAIGNHDYPELDGNSITIDGCTITAGKNHTGILLENPQTLTVKNTTINHGYFGITQNGIVPGSSITVEKTNITGTYSGIYLSNKASGSKNTLKVTDGTITSDEESAIEVKKTDITVTGTALVSKKSTQTYSVYGGGSNGCGYGIVLAGYQVGTAYEGTCSFSNNTFTLAAGDNAVQILYYNGTEGVAYSTTTTE